MLLRQRARKLSRVYRSGERRLPALWFRLLAETNFRSLRTSISSEFRISPNPRPPGNPRFSKDFRILPVTSGRISGCTCQQQSSLNKERKNNESTDSVQKNTNSAASHRTVARRRRAGPRNVLVRSYNRRPFTPEQPSQHCAAHYVPGWLARLDVQRNQYAH